MIKIDDQWKKHDSIINKIKNDGDLVSNYPTHHNFCEGSNFEGCYLFKGIKYDLFILHGWLVGFSIDETEKIVHRDREA
jgi:hypothetical protein